MTKSDKYMGPCMYWAYNKRRFFRKRKYNKPKQTKWIEEKDKYKYPFYEE